MSIFAFNEDVVRHIRNANLFQVALATAVFWDHALSFDLEVELIWKKRISPVQLLYIITRYTGDAVFLHNMIAQFWFSSEPTFTMLCQSYVKVQYWLIGATMISMQCIMVHRIHCMYQSRESILIWLLLGLGLMSLASLTVAVMMTVSIVTGPAILTASLRACLPIKRAPDWSTAPWFISLLFDIAIVALSVREGLRYMRESQTSTKGGNYLSMKNWSKQGLLFRVLVRDSIAIPFLNTAIALCNVLAWYALPLQTGALVYTLGAGAALTPILGCRLVLNLRDAYYKPFATEFEQNDLDLHIATESLDSQSPQHPFAIELDNPKRCAELRDRS